MSALGDQLNILRNTQMVQRRHLEKLYPYLDWSKMPFSSYNDFFRLKNIIDDCGAVWTNAYRRSNNEAADTRKYLKDYSGNGRDIELFNFAFAGMSGYGGYPYNFNNCQKWGAASYNNISSSRLTINAVTNGITFVLPVEYIPNRIFKAKLNVLGYDDNIGHTIWALRLSSDASGSSWENINSDGIHEVEYTLPEDATVLYIQGSGDSSSPVELSSPIYIDLLPDYPGALVSDGVDDYGQCVKDFALPDDYTVVALRKYLNTADTKGREGLISKTSGNNATGAFLFEFHGAISFSYGLSMEETFELPALFSYMSKNSFNGVYIGSGDSGDLETYKLRLFTRGNSPVYKRAALSSFGIFTRTLTEDELRIVKNCMMAEYIAMTGILDDVEYYDILDARFRSNDEDTDKRNKWTGRFGKLHMTLHNYAFSEMSGWNGNEVDFSTFNTDYSSNFTFDKKTPSKLVCTPVSGAGFYNLYKSWMPEKPLNLPIKVSGLNGGNIKVQYKITSGPDNPWIDLMTITQNGDYTLNSGTDYTSLNFNISQGNSTVTIEHLSFYPGALVSDGVDDYAVSDEVIDEPIGGIVVHAEKISEETTGYFFLSGQGYEESLTNTIASYFSSSDGKIRIGIPGKIYRVNTDNIYGYSKSPATPGHVLNMAVGGAYGDVAIYQLRLIKSQPTDIQLEAIKWQMQKEHEDYVIQNGWMEIEPDEQ